MSRLDDFAAPLRRVQFRANGRDDSPSFGYASFLFDLLLSAERHSGRKSGVPSSSHRDRRDRGAASASLVDMPDRRQIRGNRMPPRGGDEPWWKSPFS